ncbi:Beta-lactamase-like protein 2-like protein, partial [Operophtera brumata]
RILLDTGDENVPEYQKNLAEVVQSEQVNIEHIVLTHWHHDHIGGPIIWKHKRSPEDAPDAELPTTIPNNWLSDGQEISVEGATIKIHHTPGHTTDHVVLTLAEENILFSGDCILGEGTAVFEDLFTYMGSLQRILDLNPCLIYPGHGNVVDHKRSPEDAPDAELPTTIPNNWLSDGQEISVEGATIKIHHTPGHTTDHVVLTLAEENILFSGDCILGEGTAVFEDLFTYMGSLQRILDLNPCLIYPGHGNVVDIQYYIAHRNQRENQILDALKNNSDKRLNEMDLVRIIYTETPEHLWPAAAYNVNHHLTKLTKENKIKCLNVDGENKWQFSTRNCSL